MKEFKTEETVEETVSEIGINVDTITAISQDTIHPEEHPEAVEEYAPENDVDSGKIKYFTGYEMVGIVRDVINGDNIIYLCFSVILLFSIIMLIQSFRRKSRTIYILSILNQLLAFAFLVVNYFDGTLEEITQIKYGYYLFIINTFAIIIVSKNLRNLQNYEQTHLT